MINQDKLIELLDWREGLHLSLFMPVVQEPDKRQKNRIRLKNLLKEVSQQLQESEEDWRPRDIQHLLQPVVDVLDNGRFSNTNSRGIAIYLTPNFHRIYEVPAPLDELVVLGQQFHITPLLPLLGSNRQFYVLTLSQNHVQLWHGTQFSLEQIKLPDLPDSLADALSLEDPEPTLQYHTGTGADSSAIFHGHYAEKEKKGAILRYCQDINEILQKHLIREKQPLLVASVDYLFPIFQEANTYPHLLTESIAGNPEQLNPDELHSLAWEVIEPYFKQKVFTALDLYQEFKGTEKTSRIVSEIVTAAAYGQVDTLFVSTGQQIWGQFNPTTGELLISQNNEMNNDDLLNLAAAKTLLYGGTVYAMSPEDMPEQARLAAILRFSVLGSPN